MQKVADDFAAIARRLAEIEAERVYDYAVMSEAETIALQPKVPLGSLSTDALAAFEADRTTFYDSFFRRLGR